VATVWVKAVYWRPEVRTEDELDPG
jgi:hypothetical protein